MSRIVKFIPGPTLGGAEMPYPEFVERDDYTVHEQVALNVCPHNIEDDLLRAIQSKGG